MVAGESGNLRPPNAHKGGQGKLAASSPHEMIPHKRDITVRGLLL